MKELRADLWEVEAELRVITTNGYVNKKGAAVMGRGCALEAKQRYPGIPFILGDMIKARGNHVHIFGSELEVPLASFPVKHNWWEKADFTLIERSTMELLELVNRLAIDSIVMPRPGCGNGQLDWSDVKPILQFHLDNRFTVVDYV
jgi:hypothetical protein